MPRTKPAKQKYHYNPLSQWGSNAYLVVRWSSFHALGGPLEALVLNLLVDQLIFHDPDDGWFECTREFIEDRICLKKKSQIRIINSLKALGVIHTKLVGMPAKTYYKINFRILENLHQKSSSSGKRDDMSGRKGTTGDIIKKNAKSSTSQSGRKGTTVLYKTRTLREREYKEPEKTSKTLADNDPLKYIPIEVRDSENFLSVWEDFLQHRKELKKPINKLTVIGVKRAVKEWIGFYGKNPKNWIAGIEQTLTHNWIGLFKLSGNGNGNGQKKSGPQHLKVNGPKKVSKYAPTKHMDADEEL